MTPISARDGNRFSEIPRRYGWISADGRAVEAIALVHQSAIGCVLVEQSQTLVGMVTQDDVVRAIAEGLDLSTSSVQQLMRSPIITLAAQQTGDIAAVAAVFRQHSLTCLPVLADDGTVVTVITLADLVTLSLGQASRLRRREYSLLRAQKLAQIGHWILDLGSQEITCSEETLRILRLPSSPTVLPFKTVIQRIHPGDQNLFQAVIEEAIHYGSPYNLEFRLSQPDGSVGYAVINGQLIQDDSDQTQALFGTLQDITTRKEIENLQQQQARRHQVILHITQRIRQSLDLNEILQTTVTEVRQLLQADRVIIYRFEPDWSGVFCVESVLKREYSVIGQAVNDPCFREQQVEAYRQGRCMALNHVQQDAISPCHRALLQHYQVQANLVVPIPAAEQLWGLLIAHQCSAPRQWQSWEQELLQQLGIQVGIAVQQSELYEWVQQMNVELENKVQHRTERLQQAHAFEALLKGITDKVRDSLDEQQILQKVVQELTTELQISSCDTGIYDLDQQISVVQHEFLGPGGSPAQSQQVILSDFPQIYAQLLRGETLHFCWTLPGRLDVDRIRKIEQHYSVLACPLIDSHSVMGDLWLYRAGQDPFDPLEIRLVEQIANQCAIAIRQARLYETAQQQVQELAHLNRLKDEFLSSVSHELRTPMANIKMATEMMEITLTAVGMLQEHTYPHPHTNFSRYFQILKDECHRELKLINDLLDLSRLDAESDPLILGTMDLADWLHHLAEPFLARTRSNQQTLLVSVPEDLPPLTCDFLYLSRIIGELLTNACKYTPPGEQIQIRVYSHSDHVQIQVWNSGIEISPAEQEHIFERFYRIPSQDPWQHEGTGLGLALVEKLAERLEGTVTVNSSDGWTLFTLHLFPELLKQRAASAINFTDL